jgi:hypothetical protein
MDDLTHKSVLSSGRIRQIVAQVNGFLTSRGENTGFRIAEIRDQTLRRSDGLRGRAKGLLLPLSRALLWLLGLAFRLESFSKILYGANLVVTLEKREIPTAGIDVGSPIRSTALRCSSRD